MPHQALKPRRPAYTLGNLIWWETELAEEKGGQQPGERLPIPEQFARFWRATGCFSPGCVRSFRALTTRSTKAPRSGPEMMEAVRRLERALDVPLDEVPSSRAALDSALRRAASRASD